MPRVFLSPSTQEDNEYVSGGTEERYMNLLCDQIVPYLDASGIRWTRNDPERGAAGAITQANSGSYDLYVALHSNAAPPGAYGTLRGSDVYYYANGQNSRRAAGIFAESLRLVYPLPDKVRTVPTTTLGEVARSRAPAVLLEVAYHDNREDAAFITGHLPELAWAVARSIARYFALPLAAPMEPQPAVVRTSSGALRLRAAPDLTARVLTLMPRGSRVTVLGLAGDWDVVQYGSLIGYAAARYLTI